MKKMRVFSVLLALCLCVITFTGCLFSDSATIKDSYALYEKEVANMNKNNSKHIQSETYISVKIDNTDDETKNYAVLKTIEFSYKDSLRSDLSKTTLGYNVLVDDLNDLQKYALIPFCYYQEYLKTDSISKSIDKQYKKELYEAIEDYNNQLNEFITIKESLEKSYKTGDYENSNYAKSKLNALVDMNIDLVKSCIRISETTINAGLDFNPMSEKKDQPRDARTALLSTYIYDIKILVNYYDQYIEYNGVKRFNEISTNFLNIRNYISSLYNKISSNMVISEETGNYSKSNTVETVSRLDKMKLCANQAEMLSNKLDGTHYNDNVNDSNYNFEQSSLEKVYNNLLTRDEILEINQFALYI